MRTSLRTLLASLFAVSLAPPAASLTIDNFEEGILTATDTEAPGATFTEGSGLSGANVRGGCGWFASRRLGR